MAGVSFLPSFSQVIKEQVDVFLGQKNAAERQAIRQFLLALKHEQDERLQLLEAAYMDLLRQRRHELLYYCRTADTTTTTTTNTNKKDIQTRLKQMHDNSEAELGAFVKVRVLIGWQEGELARQLRLLKQSALLPTLLIDAVNDRIGHLRAFIAYVMQETL